MRITGGSACGIVLDVPKKGEVRPATDFTRERIFGRLAACIKEARVLDCFAGTGAYGLEALSRGAGYAYFLEKDPQVVGVLRNNCEKVCKSLSINVTSAVKVFPADVFHFALPQLKAPIDYVFWDPPYRFWEERREAMLRFFEQLALHFPESKLVIEYPSQFVWDDTIPWQPIYPSPVRDKKNAPAINLFQRRL